MIEIAATPDQSPLDTLDLRKHRFESLLLGLGLLMLLAPYLFLPSHNIALADDAYYYLLPAANFWKLGFYSFDGLTATNGFHPLWMALVTTCALPLHLSGSVDGLPRLVLGLSVALTIWGGVAWFGALRRGGVSQWIAALAVVIVVIACRSLFLSGLETVSVFWSLGLLAKYLVGVRASGQVVRPVFLTLYSLLVLFSRLDCGLFLLMLYGLLLLHFRPRHVFLAGAILTLLATPYFVSNMVYHGAATPISGRAKAHWGDRYELETTGKIFGPTWAQIQRGPGKTRLREVTSTVLPRDLAPAMKTLSLGLVDTAGKQKAWALPMLFGLLSFGVFRWAWIRKRLIPPARLLAALGWVLLLFYGISTLYYALSYDRVWPWYGAVGVMVMAAGIPLLSTGLHTQRLVRCLPCGVMIFLMIWWTAANVRQVNSSRSLQSTSLRAVYLDLADWLATNAPKDAVSAGWAVGEIGWNAHRPVINLEGLVGDEALLDANRATDLLPFLARYHVTHIANFWRPSLAPLPEDVLAPATSNGSWKSGPVRYFWTMRIRPMIDCPEAFSVCYRHDAGDAQETSGYVLRVDQDVVARYLKAREDWRARIASCATVLPAEDCIGMRAGQVEANLRRSEGYFVHGSDLVYALSAIAAGEYEVYGRVCNFDGGTGSIALAQDGQKSQVDIPCGPGWQHLQLGRITSATAALQASLQIEKMSPGVYLDQLYLVSPGNQGKFESLSPDWW